MGQMHHISEEDMVLLTALLDGALHATAAATLRQRLTTDDALRDAYHDLVLIRDELAELPAVHVPRSFRLDETTLRRARGWRWWFILPPGGVFTPVMSAMASLVVAVVLVQRLITATSVPAADMSMMAAPMAAPAMEVEDADADVRVAESAPMSAAVPEGAPESAPVSNASTEGGTDGATESGSLAKDIEGGNEQTALMSEPVLLDEPPATDQASGDMMAEQRMAAPIDDSGYQPYDEAWLNWSVAGILMSAILLAISIRWIIRVWWHQRHQRS